MSARNKATNVKDPHHPFEKIEIWQFLHALLEVSWHLYTKYDDSDAKEMNGKLAAGLHKFLKNDIYPHARSHVGSLYQENQDLLPMYCVFELCQRIGYPLSAKDLLRLIFVPKDTRSSSTVEAIKNFPDGINSVMIGEKVSYLLKIDEMFTLPHCTADVSRKSDNDLFANGLLVFGELGALKMVEIMTLICPGIKDADSGLIINMDYKLTFLEFYEAILEATKQLLSLRKRAEKLLQTRKIEKESTSSRNKLQEKGASRNTENSLTQKDSKVKKRSLI
ncbi:PREDICTED: uncharacterized protein LOC108549884 [Eufriesea mexicana]|uniref:uncharacterized protein LOC108549884 n=1 Tax=Eufriesea mexicana TaxID=516756 RepID=UPI00083BEAC3|nr:PREDICTED: uncharacterized protein LOC108549884 [Eufriesea mexicana]